MRNFKSCYYKGYEKIREYWDVDGLITHEDDPKKEYEKYLESHAFSPSYNDEGNVIEAGLSFEDFIDLIEFLKEEMERRINKNLEDSNV